MMLCHDMAFMELTYVVKQTCQKSHFWPFYGKKVHVCHCKANGIFLMPCLHPCPQPHLCLWLCLPEPFVQFIACSPEGKPIAAKKTTRKPHQSKTSMATVDGTSAVIQGGSLTVTKGRKKGSNSQVAVASSTNIVATGTTPPVVSTSMTMQFLHLLYIHYAHCYSCCDVALSHSICTLIDLNLVLIVLDSSLNFHKDSIQIHSA